MKNNLTVKQDKYVQCLIQGMSQRQAYRKAFPNSKKWKDRTVDARASELLKVSNVLGRYNELKEKADNEAILSRVQRMRLLSDIAVNDEERTDNQMKAIDILNKMDGDYTNKVDMTLTTPIFEGEDKLE